MSNSNTVSSGPDRFALLPPSKPLESIQLFAQVAVSAGYTKCYIFINIPFEKVTLSPYEDVDLSLSGHWINLATAAEVANMTIKDLAYLVYCKTYY